MKQKIKVRPTKKGKRGSTGPRFDERVLPQVIEEVARLRRQGFTQHKMVDELEKLFAVRVSQGMVMQYEKKVVERYRESTVEERKLYVEEAVAALMDVINEAWAGLERSKLDAEKVVKKFFEVADCPGCFGTGERKGKECSKCGGDGKWQAPGETAETREGRLPGAEYLKVVIDAWKQIAELRGLKPVAANLTAIQVNNTQNNMPANFDWKMFFDPTKAGQPKVDPVNAKIDALLDRPAEPKEGT